MKFEKGIVKSAEGEEIFLPFILLQWKKFSSELSWGGKTISPQLFKSPQSSFLCNTLGHIWERQNVKKKAQNRVSLFYFLYGWKRWFGMMHMVPKNVFNKKNFFFTHPILKKSCVRFGTFTHFWHFIWLGTI